MDGLKFTWDGRKDAVNRRKHGIGFDEARTVFYDEYARLISDPAHSRDEDRFVLLGLSSRLRILVVCHCYHEDDRTLRIISARKANPREREQYEEYRHA
jgi:uncharacterized DUF497 family protein